MYSISYLHNNKSIISILITNNQIVLYYIYAKKKCVRNHDAQIIIMSQHIDSQVIWNIFSKLNAARVFYTRKGST